MTEEKKKREVAPKTEREEEKEIIKGPLDCDCMDEKFFEALEERTGIKGIFGEDPVDSFF